MGSGDDLGDGTDNVRFINTANDILFKFLGDEVTAVCVDALGENIVDRLFAAEVSAEILLVLVGSTSGFRLFRVCGAGGERFVDGHIQLRVKSFLTLTALNLFAEVDDLLLHSFIGLRVLCRENTVGIRVCFGEGLCSLPSLAALCAKFNDSNSRIPPLNEFFDCVKTVKRFADNILHKVVEK